MELCDVTLREGDQMPGRDYDADAKIAAGKELASLGVPAIQAGFPATGKKDQRVLSVLAEETDSKISALARAVPADVEAALEADADVVEIFAPLETTQLEYMVGRSREEMLEAIQTALDVAREGGMETQLAIVDAFRTDRELLVPVFEQFADVERITLADTVGARTPASVQTFLRDISTDVDLSRVGVHFHDDLGVATANTQTAYEMGVGKADVSISSLGERAGNASLEQLVAIGDLEYDDTFGVDQERLVPACKSALSQLSEEFSARTPILGSDVTTHESGIHTAAMLEEPAVFEAFDPARFGGERTLVFGASTGAGAARKLLERVGVEPTEQAVEQYLAALNQQGPMKTDRAESLASELFE